MIIFGFKNSSILFSIILLAFGGCAPQESSMSSSTLALDSQDFSKTDLVLEGTVVEVKPIRAGSVSDAIENNPEGLSSLNANVYFQIDKILEGKLKNLKIKPPSQMDQLKGSFRNKEFLKVATLDTDQAITEIERQRFRIAVKSPLDSFEIISWENPAPQKYRLYLARAKQNEDSFILIRREKMNG